MYLPVAVRRGVPPGRTVELTAHRRRRRVEPLSRRERRSRGYFRRLVRAPRRRDAARDVILLRNNHGRDAGFPRRRVHVVHPVKRRRRVRVRVRAGNPLRRPRPSLVPGHVRLAPRPDGASRVFGPGSARTPRVRHVARARAPRPDEGSVGFVARVLVRLVARRAGEARRARARAGRAVADAAAEARRSARRVRDDRHRRRGTNHQRFGREEGGETGAEDGVGGGGGGSGVLGGGAVFAAVGMEEPAVGVVRRGRDRARGKGGRIGRVAGVGIAGWWRRQRDPLARHRVPSMVDAGRALLDHDAGVTAAAGQTAEESRANLHPDRRELLVEEERRERERDRRGRLRRDVGCERRGRQDESDGRVSTRARRGETRGFGNEGAPSTCS